MFLPMSPPLPLRYIQEAFVTEKLGGGKHFPDFLVTLVAAIHKRLNACRHILWRCHEAVHCEILHT